MRQNTNTGHHETSFFVKNPILVTVTLRKLRPETQCSLKKKLLCMMKLPKVSDIMDDIIRLFDTGNLNPKDQGMAYKFIF